MQLPNGRIIYTDPANPDTDGDGLTDYQETGIVYNVDDRYIGQGHSLFIKYFQMRSYPDQIDSDGDGLTDDVDDRPLMVEFNQVAKLNCKFSDHYFNVVGDGNTYYGGDQGWWKDKTPYQPSEDDSVELDHLEEDLYYRLWQMGCGTIAMSDAELYMTIQNSGYSLSVDSLPFDADFQQTGLIEKDAYRDYIEKMYNSIYPINDYKHGLYPTNMEKQLSSFLVTNQSSHTGGIWAKYSFFASDTQKQKILDEIERMLNEDIPVVFSYHTFEDGENIILYDSVKNAREGTKTGRYSEQDSHYMTITGLYQCPGEHAWDYKYILEVVSWGEVYYIDYDMYAKKLNWFSNILSVY